MGLVTRLSWSAGCFEASWSKMVLLLKTRPRRWLAPVSRKKQHWQQERVRKLPLWASWVVVREAVWVEEPSPFRHEVAPPFVAFVAGPAAASQAGGQRDQLRPKQRPSLKPLTSCSCFQEAYHVVSCRKGLVGHWLVPAETMVPIRLCLILRRCLPPLHRLHRRLGGVSRPLEFKLKSIEPERVNSDDPQMAALCTSTSLGGLKKRGY